ncbi:PWWP domain-containing protein [Plectosphaerella plurivora]|uniref:PWWP domain-containing protein n=1 Tax=Plectosphaerella plurivora TaxID=936078 RepID=A0A9P8VA26_9PEZI|nr:PWWP domain-containing protein [Plectosphaerella plurivora]
MSSEPTTAPPPAEAIEKKEDATTAATDAAEETPAAGADAAAEKADDKEGEPAAEIEKSDAPPKVAETVEAEAKAEAADAPVEATDAKEEDAPAATDAAADEPAVASTPVADKSKNRRKSTGTPGGKLSKKVSKAKLTHPDAQPGEFYLMKLKGYPQWPVIIADEEMLPEPLLKSRPVSAQRQDGTYREDFAEGGKRVHDRTFPVMYLYTNEFGWVPNTALQDLTSERAAELLTDKVKKKELREAFELAIQQPPLEHFKEVLMAHEESIRQDAEEKIEEKKQKAEAKKKRNSVAAPVVDDEGDFDMTDLPDEEPAQKPKSAKKRKAEEAATPQRAESVKKPKIKLTTSSTPKTTNGTSAPKAAKEASKPKAKVKKEVEEKKEPQLTPAELHERKHKEVLFLRHKLQKGLLAREGIPKEDEMTTMSDFIAKLENMPDLEASIIRSTKINKVLKAILKLSSIPKEAEFNFRSRSQTLLDKWNQVLAATEGGAATAPGAAAANGVNGDDKEASAAPAESNGVKDVEKPQEAPETEKADKASPAVAEEAKSEETTDKPAEEAAPPAPKEVDTEA